MINAEQPFKNTTELLADTVFNKLFKGYGPPAKNASNAKAWLFL
jgi:hypothetical protein